MIRIDARLLRAVYILYLIAWSVTDMRGYENSWIKYIFLIGYIVTGLVILRIWRVRSPGELDARLLWPVLLCCGSWTLISLVAMLFNGFQGPYLKDMIFLIIPALFVFVKINADPGDHLDFYLDLQIIALLASFIGINRNKLTLDMLWAVSLSEYISPFEHSSSNTWALLFLYYYTEKKWGRMIICGLFCLLTMKRISVAFVLLILTGGWLLRRLPVSNALIALCAAFFILSPLLTRLMISEPFIRWFDLTFDKSFYEFTMGRSEQLAYALNLPESKLGLGMTRRLLERYGYPLTIPHSDLLRLYWETTIGGLAAFAASCFSLAGINRSIFFLGAMTLMFLTMLVTVGFASTESWILVFMYAFHMGDSRMEAARRGDGAVIGK